MIQTITLNERHFSVKDVATMWGLSPAAIRRMFRNEPGVLRFGKERHGHQRDYVTLRIPASIAERVYRRCMRPGLVSPLAGDTRKGRA
jgi:predicted transcriptional regulator